LAQIEFTDTIASLQQELHEYTLQYQHLQTNTVELQQLVQNLSQENQQLDHERSQLNEKLTQYKTAVGSKLKQEMEEVERLRGLLAQSTHENESLILQVQELSGLLANHTTPDDSKQELEYLHNKTAELVSNLQKSEQELERLRQYLVEMEESSTQELLTMQATINEYQMQVQALEREREEWQIVNQQDSEHRLLEQQKLEESKAELANSMQQLNQLVRKQENDQQMIQNLQSVLAQFEECNVDSPSEGKRY
jgi:exonuclease SbcC